VEPQRRAMAGLRIPLKHVLLGGVATFRKHRSYGHREVQTYAARFRFLSDLLRSQTGKPVRGCRILEVGCGQRALVPLLFAAEGAEAHAIDVERPTYDMHASDFLRILKENGLDRATKSLVRHILFDRSFFQDLGAACGVNLLPYPRIITHVGDAARMKLPESYFDIVVSFAVLEHVVDVESTICQMNRALTREGIGYVTVHLFPSLSGGHCMDWQYAMDPTYPERTIPEKIPPWDHLLGNKYPADTYLNKLRLEDYRVLMSKHMVVVDERLVREGEQMLRFAPEELLKGYSRDDLTTSVAMYTVRKKTVFGCI
jgi:SAM-dependent methyltransferase